MKMETPVGEVDFAGRMQAVASKLLGEPNKQLSSKTELRYGNRGSLAIDLQTGTWHDHEAGEGGGVLGLIEREAGQRVAGGAAAKWFRENILGVGDAVPVGTQRPSRVAATYRYDDERGVHLFDVVRYDPKDFRQRAADGTWKTAHIRKVLYRLPKIVAAPTGTLVYVVEGEKDVHRLDAEALFATTNPGGAGKWRDGYSKSLIGKNVVIVPDNDHAGRDHAEMVRASLVRAGVRCAILYLDGLPEKGDVSDWLDKGNTLDDLDALGARAIEQTGEDPHDKRGSRFYAASELKGKVVPPRQWLVPDLVPHKTVTLFSGDGGTGKSLMALQLAVAVAAGTGWLSNLPPPNEARLDQETHGRFFRTRPGVSRSPESRPCQGWDERAARADPSPMGPLARDILRRGLVVFGLSFAKIETC
jgi:hypothetical protein